jgi:hypothetical protein
MERAHDAITGRVALAGAAQAGRAYVCPACGTLVTLRRSRQKVPHFAHRPYEAVDCQLRTDEQFGIADGPQEAQPGPVTDPLAEVLRYLQVDLRAAPPIMSGLGSAEELATMCMGRGGRLWPTERLPIARNILSLLRLPEFSRQLRAVIHSAILRSDAATLRRLQAAGRHLVDLLTHMVSAARLAGLAVDGADAVEHRWFVVDPAPRKLTFGATTDRFSIDGENIARIEHRGGASLILEPVTNRPKGSAGMTLTSTRFDGPWTDRSSECLPLQQSYNLKVTPNEAAAVWLNGEAILYVAPAGLAVSPMSRLL